MSLLPSDMSPTDRPLVVGVAGSLRDDSVTRQAVDRALETAAERGARTRLVDLREYDLPPVDPDAEPPADAERLSAAFAEADAIVLGTPMYNGSYASPLKTAIDHSDPDGFDGAPVGLVSVAAGQFPRRALDHLRSVAAHMGARVLPDEVAVAESHAVGEDLPDDAADRLDSLAERLVAEASAPPAEERRPSPSAGG